MRNTIDSLSASRPTGEEGVAAVEFSLVVIVLLLIVAGIVEFGRAFWYYDALTKATRDGARYMSSANLATIATAVTTTQTLVVSEANAANVSPALVSGNVNVACLDASFNLGTCLPSTPPANVRVTITNYSITLGGLLPIAYDAGPATLGSTMSPSTTMRYMN